MNAIVIIVSVLVLLCFASLFFYSKKNINHHFYTVIVDDLENPENSVLIEVKTSAKMDNKALENLKIEVLKKLQIDDKENVSIIYKGYK